MSIEIIIPIFTTLLGFYFVLSAPRIARASVGKLKKRGYKPIGKSDYSLNPKLYIIICSVVGSFIVVLSLLKLYQALNNY